MLKWICIGVLGFSLFGCATGKCLQQQALAASTTAPAAKPGASGGESMKPESKLERVKVYKPDGSLQCGQGKAISAQDMQKDLKNIKVYSSATKSDGMMRIQVCGSPTGSSNVYEIDRKDLEAALKMGFKEWTFDN
jgi:hypothetical protein